MSHMCKRIFLIQASIKQLLTKYQIFTILPQISHFHKFCKHTNFGENLFLRPRFFSEKICSVDPTFEYPCSTIAHKKEKNWVPPRLHAIKSMDFNYNLWGRWVWPWWQPESQYVWKNYIISLKGWQLHAFSP